MASSFEATTPSNPSFSVQDLRAQILANGSILCPRPPTNTHDINSSTLQTSGGSATDHLEVVLVKREHSSTPIKTVSKTASTVTATATATGSVGAKTPVNASATKRAMSEAKGLWYATLLKRTGSTNALRVVVRGEGQEEVERALVVLLEETAKRIDRLMRAYARDL